MQHSTNVKVAQVPLVKVASHLRGRVLKCTCVVDIILCNCSGARCTYRQSLDDQVYLDFHHEMLTAHGSRKQVQSARFKSIVIITLRSTNVHVKSLSVVTGCIPFHTHATLSPVVLRLPVRSHFALASESLPNNESKEQTMRLAIYLKKGRPLLQVWNWRLHSWTSPTINI